MVLKVFRKPSSGGMWKTALVKISKINGITKRNLVSTAGPGGLAV